MTAQVAVRMKEVNIRRVFREKNPKLARLIPGFIYKYLERITHQKDVNDFLRRHGDKMDLDFVKASIEDFNVTIEVEGEENLPKSGRYIFASNHPLGGFDGLVLLNVLSKFYPRLKFLVNDILMNLSNLRGLFIPINKHGRLATESAMEIEKAYESDAQMLTFPAGLVSRRIKGQIVDLEWHKSFIVKAKKYHRDIVPVHMSGRNSEFFYRLGSFRKALGIKANLEMLYLADETYQHYHKHLVVKIGKPIPWQTFDNSKRPNEWAKWVKEQAYKLDGVESIPL